MEKDFVKPEAYIDFSHLTKIDKSYMDLVQKILIEGTRCKNRTGIDTFALSGFMIEHDMSEGFPLLTTKKVLFPTMAVELEGFIKGITDKQWYKDRNCNIWNEWCNPKALEKAMMDTSVYPKKDKLEIQKEINDLGPIYGAQWNSFGVSNLNQIKTVMETLKTNPDSRRMIVSAWNPEDLGMMALPPCHVLWQINKIGDNLDLVWFQRSCDVPLGVPFNLASYALLLEIICKVSGYKPGKVIGMLSNVHIYENQIEALTDKFIPQAKDSTITKLPTLIIPEMETIFDFDASKAFVENYNHLPFVKIPLAI